MTKEEKLNWLANASNEDVVNSLRWAVLKISGSTIKERIEGQEDYDLISTEILRRMK